MSKQTRKRRHDDDECEIDAPKNKFRPFTEEAQLEEEQLSEILFGGASSFLKSLEEAEKEVPGPSATSSSDSGVGEDDSDDNTKEKTPAWFDEDDDGIDVGSALDAQGRKLPSGGINDRSNKYSTLLKQKFVTSVGEPSWASLDKPKRMDTDSDDEVLRTCGFVRKSTRANLTQGMLEFKKVKDLNCETYNEGPYINSIEFHPSSSVALVAGNGGIATLFAVDGKRNNKLHSIAFEHYPIFNAKFCQSGNEAILGSRHSHIFSYDLLAAKPIRIPLPTGLTQAKNFTISPDYNFISVAGKWGEVHLLTATSKERIALLKQDSEVTALAYSPDGNLLYGHSDSGIVTVWDMNMRRVRHRFTDEGCLTGSTMSVSFSNQFLATGSTHGVVNMYRVEDVLKSNRPKPQKTITNLTTGIGDLKFNASSDILALSSPDIKNSLRLLHVGSGTVFSNFPSFSTKLGNVNAIGFSPHSGYLAIGNRKSTVALYRLKHFKNY